MHFNGMMTYDEEVVCFDNCYSSTYCIEGGRGYCLELVFDHVAHISMVMFGLYFVSSIALTRKIK